MSVRYKSYAEYKPTGEDWLGDIPTHWSRIAIKWASPVSRGASPRPIDDQKYFDENGRYAWVRIADVTTAGRYLDVTTQRLSVLGSSLSVKLQPGDLFLSIAGSVGKPCITNIKCCIHDGFVYFPKWKGDINFLYYIFASGEPYQGLGKMGTQLNLNTDTVGGIVIGLPVLAEQRAIASFLDRETGKIDQLVSKQERMIELLKEKRQAVISHAVTKGLDPNVPMKDSGVEWLGEIPEHWDVKKMKYLCMVQTGDKDTVNAEDEGEYPFFVRSQIIERISTYTYNCEAVLTAGDGAGVGKVFHHFIGKFDFHQRVYMMNKFQGIIGRFFFLYFREQFAKVALDGNAKSTVDSLRRPMLMDFPVTVPPRGEQKKIIDFIEKTAAVTDSLVAKSEQAIELMKERRTALISAAVTGKIDVREPTVDSSEHEEIA